MEMGRGGAGRGVAHGVLATCPHLVPAPNSPTWQCFPPQPGAHSHCSGATQTPPFRQGLAQMAAGGGLQTVRT